MKLFLIKVFLFFLLIFALDKLFILVRNRLPEYEKDKRLEQVLKGEINADILILGSSRSAGGINASMLSDSLKAKAFNFSYQGSDIEFHQFLLRTYLKTQSKKPKLIVLAIDEISELMQRKSIKFRYDVLYPLVKYPLVQEVLFERSKKNRLVGNVLVRHQINYNILNWQEGNAYSLSPTMPCGSSPFIGQAPDFDKVYINIPEKYDSSLEVKSKKAAFINFVRTCTESKIQLIITFIPNYGKPSIDFENRMDKLIANKALSMKCSDEAIAFKNETYFYNGSHLNAQGAQVFTGELLKYIKKNTCIF